MLLPEVLEMSPNRGRFTFGASRPSAMLFVECWRCSLLVNAVPLFLPGSSIFPSFEEAFKRRVLAAACSSRNHFGVERNPSLSNVCLSVGISCLYLQPCCV